MSKSDTIEFPLTLLRIRNIDGNCYFSLPQEVADMQTR